MVSFENFVKSMPPSLSELKVLPSFCFAFKIPDDVAVTNTYTYVMYETMYMNIWKSIVDFREKLRSLKIGTICLLYIMQLTC